MHTERALLQLPLLPKTKQALSSPSFIHIIISQMGFRSQTHSKAFPFYIHYSVRKKKGNRGLTLNFSKSKKI